MVLYIIICSLFLLDLTCMICQDCLCPTHNYSCWIITYLLFFQIYCHSSLLKISPATPPISHQHPFSSSILLYLPSAQSPHAYSLKPLPCITHLIPPHPSPTVPFAFLHISSHFSSFSPSYFCSSSSKSSFSSSSTSFPTPHSGSEFYTIPSW